MEGDSSDEFEELIQSGYRYALSLCHRADDAADLIQQACLKILQLKGEVPSRSYLFRTVRNLFIDEWRHRPRRTPVGMNEVISDDRLQVPTHADDVQRQLDIATLLSCLRMEEREVLYLNLVEGYTAEEISALTEQPRGTVLSLLSRGRKRILSRYHAADIMETK